LERFFLWVSIHPSLSLLNIIFEVLVAVEANDLIRPVWLYTMQPPENSRLKIIFSAWNGEN
jgi:hypothetical protein